ncbi:MAG: M20/M25/M40 family metallo-hydrolase, partial [Chloroflexi bacterium]|nr:M20/M25/M40 family metallo-hydrolase [Chloroflexota bacterium]
MTTDRADDQLGEAIGEAAIEHLRALVRFDTTSPPGNEHLAAAYIADVLAAEGIESTILESAPGRANLVARLKADNPTGRPVMYMGHTDVVSVERDKWERDPFGAELVDGFIWGRGTLDMKNEVAGQLAAFVALKRAELPLTRDVIFVAFADEEVSGELGAGWMQANHPELIDAEYAINEGGGRSIVAGGQRIYLCQSGEKGPARLQITARGPAGHAATPLDGTAMAKMSDALHRLTTWEPS